MTLFPFCLESSMSLNPHLQFIVISGKQISEEIEERSFSVSVVTGSTLLVIQIRRCQF